MAILQRAKTAFTAGELAPELLGRGDVTAWGAGARRLRNVLILPTGGVRRRPGLRHLQTLSGPARLIPFEPSAGATYLLVLRHGTARVFRGDAAIADLPGPWTAAMLPNLSFTQSGASLLLMHPDMPPQAITLSGSAFSCAPMSVTHPPCIRFSDPGITLTASGPTGAVTLTASGAVFTPGHVGGRFRIRRQRLRILAVTSPQVATAEVEDAPMTLDTTAEWDESFFSNARGWPISACHHQNRLVIGGTRDAPDWLWMSRTGDPANFDPGEGLDDQAIAFPLRGEQYNLVRTVFAGRHLQVFTTAGEWMVTGDPLTPSSIQVARQTRVGSLPDRQVPPLDVDGSTIFVARSGHAVHEFSYTDVAAAYQSEDLGLVARHLIAGPVSMAYDADGRLLHVAMGDGGLATLTLYRAENVTGWTRQETDGLFRGIAESGGLIYALVERAGTLRLERFDEALTLDAASVATAPGGATTFGGFAHLEARTVSVLADGAPQGTTTVANGTIALEEAATTVQAGLPFVHVVEPMPADTVLGGGAVRSGPIRLVAATFRVLETAALRVDLGRGLVPVPLRRLDTPLLDAPPPAFTGDVTLRGLGWRRDSLAPLWRIEGDAPLPFTLLSVTTDMRTTD